MNKFFSVSSFLALFLLCSVTSFGQSIKGVVIDSAASEPALGANIVLKTSTGEFVTGASSDFMEGAFTIKAEKAGEYILEVKYIGLATKNIKVTLEAGKELELTVNLLEETNMLATATVTGSKFETPVGKTTISLDVVKPTLVENTNATKVDEVVDKVPGVSVVDGQASIRGGSGYSYGAGSRVLLMVDDLPFLQGDAGFPNWRDIPVENIGQIEVIKGAASALYGSSALNGIINIRTAYAKNKPLTKISVFHTSYGTPDRPETAWWNRDSILSYDHGSGIDQDSVITPKFLSGRRGYQKPMQAGLQFAHRRKINKFDLTLGGNAFFNESFRAGEYERKLRFNANTRYRLSEKVNFGVNTNINYGKSGSFFIWGNQMPILYDSLNQQFLYALDTITDNIYVPYSNSVTESTTLRINVDPFATFYDKFKNRHRIQTRYYYVSNDNANNQSNTSSLFYGEYQYQREFEISSNFFSNPKLVAGAVGQYTHSSSQLFGNAEYDITNAAAYVQINQGLFKEEDSDNTKLNVTFGARYEYNTIFSPDSVMVDPDPTASKILNPEPQSTQGKPVFRVGLNYEATPFTFIRASWGQGYRYPTIAERYITTQIGSGLAALSIRANPALQPETGWSAELGLKQGFKISEWKGFVDIAGFWTEYQNMMEFTFGGGDPRSTDLSNIFFQSVNIDDTRILGGEISLMGTGEIFGVPTNVMTGYTFLDPRFQNWDDTKRELSTSDEDLLKYRNRHAVKFDIESFFLKSKALSVGIYFNYNSSMAAIDKVFEDLIFNDPQNPSALDGPDDLFGVGYYRQNINAGEMYDLGARIGYRHSFKNADNSEKFGAKISFVAKNILNQERMVRPALAGAPVNFTVRLDFEF